MSPCSVCGAPCPRPVCGACVGKTRALLAAVPGLWDELAVTLTRQGKTGSPGMGGGSVEPALPLHLGASTARHRLHGVLRVWVKHLSADARTAGVRVMVTVGGVGALAGQLTEHLEWAAGRDWFPQFHASLKEEISAATRCVDTPPMMLTLGTCGNDDCPEPLRAPEGAKTVECGACEAVWDVAEKRAWLHQNTTGVAVTQVEATRILGVSLDQYQKWVRRGFLTPIQGEGRHAFYNLSDAARLLRLSREGKRLSNINQETKP